jgi:formylglycine-generating enzyme required for sulfatase activity
MPKSSARDDAKIPTPQMGDATVGGGQNLENKEPVIPVKWILVPKGEFVMYSDTALRDNKDEKAARKVRINDFEMSETLVTVEQYGECVKAGDCQEPDTKDPRCNWGKLGLKRHPVNCVDWDQANIYTRYLAKQAEYINARLPSEAEWEYAARSGGMDRKYPWGDEKPTCERVVMNDMNKGSGCGTDGTLPVCSLRKGNTKQGLCDMAGKVFEWVQDKYDKTYEKLPDDGAAILDGSEIKRVVRGGAFHLSEDKYLRADKRGSLDPASRSYFTGFRVARSR